MSMLQFNGYPELRTCLIQRTLSMVPIETSLAMLEIRHLVVLDKVIQWIGAVPSRFVTTLCVARSLACNLRAILTLDLRTSILAHSPGSRISIHREFNAEHVGTGLELIPCSVLSYVINGHFPRPDRYHA